MAPRPITPRDAIINYHKGKAYTSDPSAPATTRMKCMLYSLLHFVSYLQYKINIVIYLRHYF